jgi:hypothetical protein
MRVFQVIEWDQHFENSKSRERKDCSFVCVPNKQSGLGFSRMMAHKNGAAVYGIWCLLLGALSRQTRANKKGREGWLTHDGHSTGTPWTVSDLSLLWRRPEAEIEVALNLLVHPSVGWIQAFDRKVEAGTTRLVPVECPHGALEGRNEGSEGNINAPSYKPGQRPKGVEELIEYGKGPNCGLTEKQCRVMWDHYETNGWTINGIPISDWRACARKWKTNQGNHEQTRTSTGRTHAGSGESSRAKNIADAEREGIVLKTK